jgi:hypothetical protein
MIERHLEGGQIDVGASRRIGFDVRAAVGSVLDDLLAAGCLEWHGDRLRVTEESILVTSELLARLETELLEWRDRQPASSGVADAQASAQLADRTVLTGR